MEKRALNKKRPVGSPVKIRPVLLPPSAAGARQMKQVMLYIEKNKIISPVVISAQLYLKKFYENYGLKAIGDIYNEDNIPHIKMKGFLHFQPN